MSANRDKGQRFTFLYSNLYQIHKKSEGSETKEPKKQIAIPTRPEDSRIIKVGDLKAGTIAKHYQVTEYSPAELVGKKAELAQNKRELQSQMEATDSNFRPHEALEGLKDNLKQLKDLHSRLKFMLTELEELTKK